MNKTKEQPAAQQPTSEDQINNDSRAHQFDNPTELQPGTSDAPQQDSEQMTHGVTHSIGLKPSDPNNRPGSNPQAAGDVDKSDTDSATETGQDGDLTDIHKKKAYNYS